MPEATGDESTGIEVAASLWSVPAERQHAAAAELAGHGLRRMHWDMTDGRFARAGGFSADGAREVSAGLGLAAEVHIMARSSSREVDAWTDFCDLVIVHAESADWQKAVDRIVRRGCEPGLALSAMTPASVVPEGMTALCMSITPGEAGSAFDPAVIDKIRTLRESSDRRVGVDGGVTRDIAARVADAGASWVAVGNDLVGTGGLQRWADLLRGRRARSGS